jgi:solute carrier family 35 protein F5
VTTDGTTLSDRRPKNALLGDGLALLSAICYAVYVILLKVKIEDEERVDMQLFFGYVRSLSLLGARSSHSSFVGLFNTVFLLPVIPIFLSILRGTSRRILTERRRLEHAQHVEII